jgi:hypothetical protein
VSNCQEHSENKGKHRLESEVREKLVKRAIEMFNIAGKFDVPKQTIFNHIKADWLEVWHSGTQSPVLEVEIILISFIFTTHRLCCLLDMGDVIALMNALISGTAYKKRVIQWEKITVLSMPIHC